MAEKKVVKRKGLKNVRKAKKRRARNLTEKKKLKAVIKAAKLAIAAGAADATDKIKKAVSVIDKAAERGILHRNTASRKKSRLFRMCNRLKKQ